MMQFSVRCTPVTGDLIVIFVHQTTGSVGNKPSPSLYPDMA